jgi:hypothetical protein|tara:strand:+ start:4528 stop:4884 length:357 start_codon:yes stop_codon:yes gene_type:complete
MAITTSASDWTAANVNKTLSIQAALTSKLRCYKIKCTAGGSDAYATNGVAADLKEGRISTLVAVIPEDSSADYIVKYDKTNEKIKLFTVGGSAGAALAELANSTTIANKTFEFLVFGY